MQLKRQGAKCLLALLLAAGRSAQANDNAELEQLRMLVQKLENKVQALEQKSDEVVAKQNATANERGKSTGTPVLAVLKDGIGLESEDGKHAIALTGRVHVDYRDVSGDDYPHSNDTDTASMSDQFELRRARLGVKGRLYKDFEFEVVTSLLGSSANLVDVAWLNYAKWKPAQLRIGKFKQPFTLEDYGTSSNNTDFMERSYLNALYPGKKVGVMLHGVPLAGVTYAASYYQQNDFGETDNETDGKGVAGRVTANFSELAGWKGSVLHLGLAGFDSEYGLVPATSKQTSSAASTATRGTVLTFRTDGRGLSNIHRLQIGGDTLSTTAYGANSNTSADMEARVGALEFSAAYGSLKLQGEYAKGDYDAIHSATGNRVSADVDAYYAELMWLISGEHYADSYKNGSWGSIKPRHLFDIESGKGLGAWEAGLRYDRFHVEDIDITHGSNSNSRTQGTDGAKSYTAGIKWILNPNMRFLLNYSHTKYDEDFVPIDVTGATMVDSGTHSHDAWAIQFLIDVVDAQSTHTRGIAC